MRYTLGSLAGALALAACGSLGTRRPTNQMDLRPAEEFIDAFYSFNSARLLKTLSAAPKAIPEIVFYQGWAQGGNYEIVARFPCKAKSAQEVTCAVTAKDDLMAALRSEVIVTDTFHLSLLDGKIVAVRTSANDPDIFNDALAWVKRERPELLRVPCRGYFSGGPTPDECVKAMVQGFVEFAAIRPIPPIRSSRKTQKEHP